MPQRHHVTDALDAPRDPIESAKITPLSYRGLFAFHKYWGKKPIELVSSLITTLSEPGDLVIDPFLGSGAIARESHRLDRRFAGTDVNPVAVELTRMTCELPDPAIYNEAIARLTTAIEPLARELYALEDGGIGTHYLWDGDALRTIWTYPNVRVRQERPPTDFDRQLASQTDEYQLRHLRALRIEQNSRINAVNGMQWNDFFSGRALTIIEAILDVINAEGDVAVRRALRLTLTSAMGQMSKMVFALEKRGLVAGSPVKRVEVGSWAIGLWRPETHFEVNAWNCFVVRSRKLSAALKKMTPDEREYVPTVDSRTVDYERPGTVSIDTVDALRWLESLPDASVSLVVTDPPHGDRIPYLELSELWNAALDYEPELGNELIVSNAPGRTKSPTVYFELLGRVFDTLKMKLSLSGHIALMYNSTSTEDWAQMRGLIENAGLRVDGLISADYSVRSLLQDNRAGALKNDVVVLISHPEHPVNPAVVRMMSDNSETL
ncbi:MAG: hypothetical protein JWQ43_868 [Glaciihabitans sp.]|nr:hypothetical protein [Glaciihabitans sp.]